MVLEPAGSRQACPRQVPLLTVGFALTKGDRPEWTVQKLTELGVDRIVPLVSERCVVRWDRDKAARNLDRLRQVARQAATQSRQAWLPEISPMATFAELTVATFAELTVASFAELTAASFADIPVGSAGRDHVSQTAPAGVAARLGLAVPGGGPLTEELTGLLVGPEGGWSDAEERAGLPRVGLGPTILRAETAAVAAGVLLTARRAGLVTTSAGPSSNSGPASVPSPTVGK